MKYQGEIAFTGFCVLRSVAARLNPAYLFYFTQTDRFVKRLSELATGAGYPAVTDGDVFDTQIPLPTLRIQQHIGNFLEKADRLRRLRRYAQQVSETFLQAVFVRMFGSFLGKARATTSMGELVTITGGGTPSRAIGKYYEGNIPWLTSKDMKGDFIVDTQEHVTEEAIQKSATKLVAAGSILLVVKSKVLMHRLPVAIAMVSLCHGQDIKSIQCSKQVNALFLVQVLKHNEPDLLLQARGANTEGLTLPMLHEIPVPNVPLQMQERFAQIAQKHFRLRAQQREAERQAEHLFQTLLKRAFVGEL